MNVRKNHLTKKHVFLQIFCKKNYTFRYIADEFLLNFLHFFNQKKYQKNTPKSHFLKITKTRFSQIFFIRWSIF
jgi:hypothetical protein